MRARNWFESLNTFKLTLERTWIVETSAVDDFHRAHFAKNVTSQPHFAVSSDTDPLQKFVIGNKRLLGRIVPNTSGPTTGGQPCHIIVQQSALRMHAAKSYGALLPLTIAKSLQKPPCLTWKNHLQ